MTQEVFAVWSSRVFVWLWSVGMLGLLFGLAIDRLAKARGWAYVRRIVPALVIAFLLCGLAIVERRGVLAEPVRSMRVRTQPTYEPYCESWLYWTNSLCWFTN